MTPLANQTLSWAFIVADANTGAGTWEEAFADIALVQPDGTVTTLYNNQLGLSLGSGSGTSGVSGQNFWTRMFWNAYIPDATTHYFLSDHLGSARMEFAGAGWPVWSEDFAPYGQEVNPAATSNLYKFTGQERDPESASGTDTGNDFFNARYYNSMQGRFTSPDPSGLAAVEPADPQTWNLYGYAINNPLEFIDPTGNCASSSDATVIEGIGNGSNGTEDRWEINPLDNGSDCSSEAIIRLALPKLPGDPTYLLDSVEFQLSQARFGLQYMQHTRSSPAQNNPPNNCHGYLDPISAGFIGGITFKAGVGIEAGDISVDLGSITKTVGESGIGAETSLGFKGIASIQRVNSSYPTLAGKYCCTTSVTLLGFNHDFAARWSDWTFQPSKEFRGGAQSLLGIEFGWSSKAYQETVNYNNGCGYKSPNDR